jgi:hypothetical protein
MRREKDNKKFFEIAFESKEGMCCDSLVFEKAAIGNVTELQLKYGSC